LVFGGVEVLSEKLAELRQELDSYFGMLAQFKEGIHPKVIIEKPIALIYLEQIQMLGIPLVEGGVLDQPYIFMQEMAVCAEVVAIYAAQEKANKKE
jgi:hypothetical protein